jgi:tRNA-splicing ligase RtcB
MNAQQLRRIGVPDESLKTAVTAIQQAVSSGAVRGKDVKPLIRSIVAAPADYVGHPQFGALAASLVEAAQPAPQAAPIEYQTWGTQIEPDAHRQMTDACSIPSAFGAALMPDAHVGYGLPIGGVLATENTVIPYAVGVDIACRMKLSVLDMPVPTIEGRFDLYRHALEKGTRFGIGSQHDKPQDHPVMDRDWSVSRITRESRDKAWRQLGTSGSGNHFVEFGVLSAPEAIAELDLPAGQYVALLSHSGSRGTGAAVCSTYSAIAQSRLKPREQHFGRLAWLDLDSEPGREYWEAMNLMGDYAAANHEVIHRLVSKLLGARIVAVVENHHNFAWKERHGGREVIVHRKGATPASAGELGVIPGSMADPAFIVRGKGVAASLNSASHGAGRRMSRTQARQMYNWNAVRKDLEKKGVRVLSAGADEVPGVYKPIEDVMREQQELVDSLARFDPRIVKMCGDASRPED